MLKPQEAERRLKELKIKNGKGRRLARIAELPESARAIGYGIYGSSADGGHVKGADAREKRVEAAFRELDDLSPADREQLFEALFPQLGRYVEGAWQMLGQRPYQHGWVRRAFRAPGDNDRLRAIRRARLDQFLEQLKGYEQDIAWLAAWTPYLFHYWAEQVAELLAAAIDAGGPEGQEVFEILCASARGEHPVGVMGRHVTGALLCASRPDGWEFVERLLLAAQREEGLRQTILESVDQAHPEAFRRMVRLILEHDLLRFSATIRALDVWFGFQLEATDARMARGILEQVLRFLEDPSSREAAIHGGEARAAYLALWATAFENAPAAVAPAVHLLSTGSVESRYAAALLLSQLGLPESRLALVPTLDDPDLRVALTALSGLGLGGYYGGYSDDDEDEDEEAAPEKLPGVFEALTRLVARVPKKENTAADLVWPGNVLQADQSTVAGALVSTLGERSPSELIPYLPLMEPYTRSSVVGLLSKKKLREVPEVRDTLLSLAGDAAETVRESALKVLGKQRIDPAEAPRLEGLLTRKAADLRRGVIGLLLNQDDEAALASAERLAGAKNINQRTAGLEVLQQLCQNDRQAEACRRLAAEYPARQKSISDAEKQLLDALAEEAAATAEITLKDGLGLFDPAALTPAERPQEVPGLQLESEAAGALLQSLDDLVHQHRETPVRLVYSHQDAAEDEEDDDVMEPDQANTVLLGEINWGLPSPQPGIPAEKDAARLPLREVWEEWWAARPPEMRDPDGMELVRALAMVRDISKKKLRHREVDESVLEWLFRLSPPAEVAPFLLGAAETVYARVPEEKVRKAPNPNRPWAAMAWRSNEARHFWIELARSHRRFAPEQWREEDHNRLWRLLHWLDKPTPEAPRFNVELEELLQAWRAGGATEADLIELLLGTRGEDSDYYYGSRHSELEALTGRKPSPHFESFPGLREIVDRCRDRVLEVELARGELPSPATPAALSLRSAGGLDTLVRILKALGRTGFIRGWIYNDQGRTAVFSKLLRSAFPEEGDTPERFREQAEAAKLPAKRLVEVAMYTPQWARHVEHALGWPGFEEAVWWVHAHTKDDRWSVDEDIRENWTAQASQRTPLTAQNLIDGAVDVAWFHRVYQALGPDRWSILDEAAKYASGGGGHKRAQLFADAMLGRVSRESLVSRVQESRNQDSLRALGLLPLPEPTAEREAEVLERYRIIQEFLRTSRQFGSQRQASEKLASGIAMENLARTAGYADPVRLEWAMEAREIADLAGGALVATAAEVTVTLSINDLGEPDLAFVKNGKALKALPAAAKKDPDVAALVARKRDVQRQASRMRVSLENAMCRGDRFTGAELHTLSGHPVLAPMLRNLVFLVEPVSEGEGGICAAGYPTDGGRELEAYDGSRYPVGTADPLRLAHPHDLLRTGEWHLWQRDCFRRERVQPFKQVFRELYVLTEAEQQGGVRSVRYAGHQIQNRRAMALLGKRGWVSNYEESDVRRTFHTEGLTAWLEFDAGITTPAEVEGLTVEHVGFSRRGEWKPLRLDEVPPRIFSEIMRDVDLIVSVAHAGGVDPEATQSTVEMRASLLRETCTLLKLENVRLQNTHALIDGKLGTYSVHLGSAVVHRQPGGHLCIVPVHSQHRGRLFLPFADNDPRTAEVISKALLLARDHEIKDPTILEQIYAQ